MKKLLALVLALVMSMSLVTISNAAFKDADKISNKEAVDVMAAVGVLAGYDNGEFGATDTLTRAQACKIIAYLDLGGKTADAIKGTGTVFSDVKATSWYAGYVEYCAGAGYVAGIGGGKFDPDAKVTGVQFAKMLLCALGYKSDVEGYTGADYTIAIARDANKNDLYKDLSITVSANLSREQAAQMAFNALKATVVEYKGGTNISTSDGTKVVINAERNEVETTATDYRKNGGDAKQQLCEKLYSKLVLDNQTSVTDKLGRPAHTWIYKSSDVGTYADSSDYNFVVNKSGYKLADAIKKILSKDNFDTASAVLKINGETKTVGSETLKVGDVVELFMKADDSKKVATATVIRYAADEVTGDVETSSKDGKDYVKVPGVVTGKVETKTVKGYEGLVKGDHVYKYTAGGVTYLAKANSFEGKLTEIKGSGANAKYVIGGSEYMFVEGVSLSTFNTLYTFYTTADGYIIEAVEKEEALSDYVAIQAANKTSDSGVENSAKMEARFVKVDGSTFVGKLAKIDSTEINASTGMTGYLNRKFYTYTLNSDNEYELKSVDFDKDSSADKNTNISGVKIENKKTSFGSTYYVDDDTVFVVAKGTGSDAYKYDVYTGKNAVPTIEGANGAVVTDKNSIAKYVLIASYSSNDGSDGNKVLFVKSSYESMITEKVDGKDVTYYTYQVIDDTTLKTIKVKDGVTGIAQGSLMTPTYDKNDLLTKVASTSDLTVTGNTSYKLSSTTLITNKGAYVCASDAPVFVVNADGDVSETTAADYSFDSDATSINATIVLTKASGDTVKYVFVIESDI